MANHVKAEMAAIMDSLSRLREKRDGLRGSEVFEDQIHANSLDAVIGDKEERLAELERKYPTEAQKLKDG